MAIIYQVAVAVQVIDDFNDKVLTGAAIQVRIAGGGAKPVRKQDGYFVFLAGQKEIRQIEVESPLYHKAVVDIELRRLNPLRPVLKVRLQPNRLYAVPGGATYLEGKAEPGSLIHVIPETRQQTLKLLYDYEKGGAGEGREIRLFRADKKDLSGKHLAIRAKEQEEPEVFQVLEMSDPEQGTCVIAAALGKGYKKAGAEILSVYTATADSRGDYYLLLPGLEGKDTCDCRVKVATGKAKTVTTQVKPGQGNRLDLV
ncbi:MAG: hypothetical protein LBH09_04625 [Peptococcaceae bacterium]|jgi:hypothetical protein|nr:hypothetical protein [Peptococcaceae bacterium]